MRVASVAFYHDVDSDGRLTLGTDTLLGTDTDGADGWAISTATGTLPLGDIQFLAQASYDGGLPSQAVSATTFLHLASTTYVSSDVGQKIRDLKTVTSTLNVPDSFLLGDVDVTLTITHSFNGDLDVYLIHPDGTWVELFTDVGGISSSNRNFIDTTLDDRGDFPIIYGNAPYTGSFRPEGLLSTLNGKDSSGTWKLEITDDERANSGTLDAWSLTLTPQVTATPALSIDDVSVTEGDTGMVMADFTVTRSGDLSQTVTVDYSTADGTATAGSDYTGSGTTTLTFAPGVSSLPVAITVHGDANEEPDETFFVNLSNPVGATISAAVGTATIVDDDSPIDLGTLFVYDIHFDSKRGGKDYRAVFEIRSDSDGDGQASANDNPAAGVFVTVTFAGVTYDGVTDSNGVFRTSWERNLSSGDYYANAIDLALEGFVWSPFDLDLEDDSDTDGWPDALLTV